MPLLDLPLFTHLRQKAAAPIPAWIQPALEPGHAAWLCLAPARCLSCAAESALAVVVVQDPQGAVVGVAATTEDGVYDDPIAEELQAWLADCPWLPIGPVRSANGWGAPLCHRCGRDLEDAEVTPAAARQLLLTLPAERKRAIDAGEVALYYLDLRQELEGAAG